MLTRTPQRPWPGPSLRFAFWASRWASLRTVMVRLLILEILARSGVPPLRFGRVMWLTPVAVSRNVIN